MPVFRLPGRRRSRLVAPSVIPVDPRLVLDGPLDPDLDEIRVALRPQRRRLWLRRIVRRTWLVAVAVAGAEVVLFAVARIVPLETLASLAIGIPLIGLVILAALAARARPSIGETALAVDAEADLGDRVASALALAVAFPDAAGPAMSDPDPVDADDDARQAERFIRRQRLDAAASLRLVPASLFGPRLARRPALATLAAALLLVPLILVPNPQDDAIARTQAIRDEARHEADRIEQVARDLESKGTDPNDPRARLARELRDLAAQMRSKPEDLKLNLASLGSVEEDVRAQLDPANEQRASALSSVSRALSRAATGQPNANKDGDPKIAAQDLKDLGKKLDGLTPEQRRQMAAALAEQQSAASQASGAAGQALRDAVQSISQGDTAAAQDALNRLGEALQDADTTVDVNRDLAGAASKLQDARRNLANAGQQGQQGQTGQPGQPGQAGQGGQAGRT